MSKTWSPFQLQRTNGQAPFVLVCEHASSYIPEDFPQLALGEGEKLSHAVWDIGALKMAESMSRALDAPLISGGVSRSIYDCNRPFSADDCIPTQSEEIHFPGNKTLSIHQRRARRHLIHDLFHTAVGELIENQNERTGGRVALVTLHSFTPVYYGKLRDVEIGFLHHGNAQLSECAAQVESSNGQFKTALNEPYGKDDGVTYSICRHADANRLESTMIEVRNDLIADDADAERMGQHLAKTIQIAMDQVKAVRAA